jgi:hypothetical protein
LKPLTPHQLAGQLMMVRLFGTSLDVETERFLRDNHIRATCLFRCAPSWASRP